MLRYRVPAAASTARNWSTSVAASSPRVVIPAAARRSATFGPMPSMARSSLPEPVAPGAALFAATASSSAGGVWAASGSTTGSTTSGAAASAGAGDALSVLISGDDVASASGADVVAALCCWRSVHCRIRHCLRRACAIRCRFFRAGVGAQLLPLVIGGGGSTGGHCRSADGGAGGSTRQGQSTLDRGLRCRSHDWHQW